MEPFAGLGVDVEDFLGGGFSGVEVEGGGEH